MRQGNGHAAVTVHPRSAKARCVQVTGQRQRSLPALSPYLPRQTHCQPLVPSHHPTLLQTQRKQILRNLHGG